MLEQCVFIVDDDPVILESTEALVNSIGRKAETFSSAEAFLDFVTVDHTGCVIADYCLGDGMFGLELQKTLKQRAIYLPLIFVTAYGKIPLAVLAMKQGAVTLLEKPSSDNQLIETIEEAFEIDRRRRRDLVEQRNIEGCINSLSPEEFKVMEMVTDGLPNKEISETLGISVRTVESRRRSVFEKMKVADANVAILVRKILRAGLQ